MFEFLNKNRGISKNCLYIPISLYIFCFINSSLSIAQDYNYYNANRLRFDDYIYDSLIHSVQLYPEGETSKQGLDFPLLNLGEQSSLLLDFDDFRGEYVTYNVKFIHCNFNWTPSVLSDAEFLSEYNLFPIYEFRNSFNTLQKYMHYHFKIPPMLVTGNYLLLVFRENDEQALALTKRFVIYQKDVVIEEKVGYSSNVPYREKRHELDFRILFDLHKVNNPRDEIKVVLRQNGRWDNAITNLKPLFIKEGELMYDYSDENNFDAGNEFRWFDTRSFRYITQYVEKINADTFPVQVYLKKDTKRKGRVYTYENDINGRYLIMNRDATVSSVEADYGLVHFQLDADPVTNGTVYLIGSFTGWKENPSNRMIYNEIKHEYSCSMYLKQGYYNYQYGVKKYSGEKGFDVAPFEGNFAQTENEYDILVYQMPMGGRYEKVIGYKTFRSGL
ncbi:MAG: hypothetical protein A3H98_04565 [Bacteroidetes bacterium RIFCSPLOWO2_02_FULL_36_8]|nr:MAG: hypothetical protein A3H98_04565 [Bacteroidetes bacterium RIFCSPLOWO2_02_FULL_36_8]OFY70057.1 MAG: hypothetical protein A3G23_13500 [Bacteroidetes bacterium RIFCSPLOWO2_12_FULL_37_12]